MQIVFTDGLGNEMFQYALYLAMKQYGRNPSINTSIISRKIVHNGFELCDDFEIDQNCLNIVDGGKVGGGFTILAIRHLWRIFCYREKITTYDPAVFKTRKPLISGYWQDERYFENVQEDVRNAFVFRNIDNRNILLGKEMSACDSVSLHIRRGDYLKFPNLLVCTPSYYNRAIDYIKEHVKNPVFYVFSDDLDWSEQFMKKQSVEFHMVGHNRGKDSYKDMYLMTCCRHNIIANSSFSWWGAWLGKRGGKIVVRPSEWIKGKSKDPCPANWVKVDNPPPHYGSLNIIQILKREYKDLETGKKPYLLFAVKAFYLSDNFRLLVLMRWKQSTANSFLKQLLRRKLIRQYSSEIASTARVGRKFVFNHVFGIVIGNDTIIGENCHIFQGVTLGQSHGFFPKIGNNVILYPYSCVLGDVVIGDNSVIAAHAVVTHDVPSNCMVAGNPAKVMKYFNSNKPSLCLKS